MTYRFSTHFRSTIYQVMLERGWEDAGDSQDFDFAWLNKEEISAAYTAQQSQKKYLINHYQNHQMLSRKDLLAQNVQKCWKLIAKTNPTLAEEFKTIPLTFILPENYSAFVRYAETRSDSVRVVSNGSTVGSVKRGQNVSRIPGIEKLPPRNDKTSQLADKPPQQLKRELSAPNLEKPNISRLTTNTGDKFIVKPACLLQGQGIFIATLPEIQTWYETEYQKIKAESVEMDAKIAQSMFAQYQKRGIQTTLQQIEQNFKSGHDLYLIQKYIENPLLINGHKFDCRIYVLVKSFKPLNCYICNEGFARFALKTYTSDDLSAHLTNVAIQKKADDYDSDGDGAKWGLFQLFQYIQTQFGKQKAKQCQRNVEMTVLRTLQSVANQMNQSKQSFEIYGFDVMLTSDLQVQICEVNACPSLSADTKEDELVKKRMLHDALSIEVDNKDQRVFGCFHQLFYGNVDEKDYNAGIVETGVLLGDQSNRCGTF
ncbi:Tubulin_tyrosine ligase [Hexamita inflata]|uniref:Tubulin--tyrosine ligase-like protein 9 n=1 Tax=Hexamita inflata TaxID=28002 RepID=A0AA86QF84_9EUKA|nr:Tubulin tyrosine ligase [Hexamita inflata]